MNKLSKQILNNINLLNSNKPFDIEQNIIIKDSIGYKYFVETQILKIVYQNHKYFYESNYFTKIKYDNMMLNEDHMILTFDGSDEKHDYLIKLLKFYAYGK